MTPPRPPHRPDPRADDEVTPLPDAMRLRNEMLLANFLERKHDEAEEGYTLPNLFKAVGVVAKEQERQSRRISEHDRTLQNHTEELKAHQEWIDEQNRMQKEIGNTTIPSLPPMRSEMATGRFEVNLKAMEEAIEAERERFRQYEKSKMAEEIVELKTSRRWWGENAIQWSIAAVGATALAVLTWILGRLSK